MPSVTPSSLFAASFSVGPVTAWPGAGTILLVEDQEFVAELLMMVFARAGLSVVRVGDGAEALRVLAEERGKVRLAMIDIGLPDIAGDDLGLALRELVPGLPVILTSGREAENCREKLLASGPTWFAAKPYKTAQLVEQVRALLMTAA
jgi:DNA-binding response OmpR family regulator